MADTTLFVKIKATDEFSGTFNKAGKASDNFGSKLKSLAKGAAIGGAIAALGGLAAVVKMGIDEFNESQKVQAQTEAVLKSTGNAANVTGDHISELATKLRDLSGVDDEAIQAGENLLLTFTNIRNEVGQGNDIFDQATKAALDMSVALGLDMTDAAMKVGKALQDPIIGVTALRRSGVMLTDQQEEMVKKFMEVGDIMGAQKIILGELTKEFGGSAEAAGKTFGGQLAILKGKLEDIAGAVMEKILPTMQKWVEWLNANLPQIVAVIGSIVNAFQEVYNFLVWFFSGIVDAFVRAYEGIVAAWNGVIDFFQAIWHGIEQVFWNGVKVALQIVEKLLSAASHLPFIGGKFGEWRDDIKGAIEDVDSKLDENVEKAKAHAKGVEDALKKLGPATQTNLTQMAQVITNSQPELGGAMKGVVSKMVGEINLADLQNPTKAKIDQMASAIAAKSGAPQGAVTQILNNMVAAINASNTYDPTAQKMNEVALAIDGSKPGVLNAIQAVLGSMGEAVGSFGLFARPIESGGYDEESFNNTVAAIQAGLAAVVLSVTTILGGHSGGAVMHGGGPVRMHSGGLGSNERPAILEKGEFVINKRSVKKYGMGMMQAINSGKAGGATTININAGAYMGSPGDARRFAAEIQKYLSTEGVR